MDDGSQTDRLGKLADLVRKQNAVAREIASVVGRPAQIGHVGEFIASRVFGIELAGSAVNRGFDGVFKEGPLARKTVNIKWYAKKENLLDIREDALPDYFLVLTGPQSRTQTSRGEDRLWWVESVFLFESQPLLSALRNRGVKIGIASSVISDIWRQAEIYPNQNNAQLVLTSEQRNRLALFSARAIAER
ncbi:MAG: hypothetical protein JW952_01120 [Candidatus Eisenbacteria bacterium]|nr:hypothetical protein [Candidatus Eisenbacteria bacterium]